jgi:hypothetical protein
MQHPIKFPKRVYFRNHISTGNYGPNPSSTIGQPELQDQAKPDHCTE